MSNFEIGAGDAGKINFAPSTIEQEVLQNVATILATVRNTVPYDRALGINPDYLDDPTPVTRSRLIADIISAIHSREPRAKVTDVVFKEDQAEGVLIPTVRVIVNG